MPVPDAAARLRALIEHGLVLSGVKVTLIDEPADAQIWVSLADTDVPLGESFCFAGGDTHEEALSKAVALFRRCADELALLVPVEGSPAPRLYSVEEIAEALRPHGMPVGIGAGGKLHIYEPPQPAAGEGSPAPAQTWTGFNPKRLQECGISVERHDFWVRDAVTREVRLMTEAEWSAVMSEGSPAPEQETIREAAVEVKAALDRLHTHVWSSKSPDEDPVCLSCYVPNSALRVIAGVGEAPLPSAPSAPEPERTA